MGIVALIGIVIGLILTIVIGEPLANLVLQMAGLGISQVHFIVNPIFEYILCPFGLLGFVVGMTAIVMKSTRNFNIISKINE